MIEYYDISGFYIQRPWSMSIWEILQGFSDAEIKKMTIKNSYFPLFVSPAVLRKEKDHIEGFAPEVAFGLQNLVSLFWKYPLRFNRLVKTETVMYPYISKWIRGHRGLPLRLNQWCNVVRWEFSNPTLFIRSPEFLFQEGHTAFATNEESDAGDVEKDVKECTKGEMCAAKMLCSPFDQPELPEGKPAKKWTYWGRSY